MRGVITGDALKSLSNLEAGIAQTCITSPPYYSLRDYGVDGQIGLEETPEAYVERLVEVFRELRRVLRDDGILWLNLGDSYSQTRWSAGEGQPMNGNRDTHRSLNAQRTTNLPPKNLLMMPARVALALQADGWILRSDIIWQKPQCMPEPVKDRPTKSHEHIFLFAKQQKYYYDHEAIMTEEKRFEGTRDRSQGKYRQGNLEGGLNKTISANGKANKRDVWSINPAKFKDAHFATFPEELVENCIKAGTKEGDLVIDPFSGAGTTGVVAAKLLRQYLGIELNPEYVGMSEKRIAEAAAQNRMFI